MKPITPPDEWEPHFTVGYLAKKWHLSINTVRPWFENEPGVIRIGTGKLRPGKKRTLIHLRVPASVARRVYERHTRIPA
jgi:hypothetical protein